VGSIVAYLPQSVLAGFVAGAIVFAFWDTWWGWIRPSPKKVTEVAPAPMEHPEHPNEPPGDQADQKRVYLPKDITAVDLAAYYHSNTNLEADHQTAKYIDKWMVLSGIISNISKLKEDSIHVILLVSALRERGGLQYPDTLTLSAEFPGENNQFQFARKGNVVKFRGRIESISATWVRFDDCELIEIATLDDIEKRSLDS
jgi:hypothetical protein